MPHVSMGTVSVSEIPTSSSRSAFYKYSMSLTNKLAFQDLHIENIPPAAMSIVEIGLRLPLLKLSSLENCFGLIRHSLTWINWPQKAHVMLSFIDNIGNEHRLGCLATVLGIPRTAPASNFVVAARSIGVAKYLHHRCVQDSEIKNDSDEICASCTVLSAD